MAVSPTPLDLLVALHEHPTLSLQRVGDRVRAVPRVPEEARGVLVHYREALVQALADGERVEAGTLISVPARLAALLAHALGVGTEPVGITYRQYTWSTVPVMAPPRNLTPHLAWASRLHPPERRIRVRPPTGNWEVEVQGTWEVAAEVRGRPTLVAALTVADMEWWCSEVAMRIPFPERAVLWRPGRGRPALIRACSPVFAKHTFREDGQEARGRFLESDGG